MCKEVVAIAAASIAAYLGILCAVCFAFGLVPAIVLAALIVVVLYASLAICRSGAASDDWRINNNGRD